MCNWICTFERCPTCDAWKKITSVDILCVTMAAIRGNPQFCDNYRDYDNIIVGESPCETCNNKKDVEKDMISFLEALDEIPDVPSPPDLGSLPQSNSFTYSDSEYGDDEEFGDGDDTSKMYILGKAVSMSMTSLPDDTTEMYTLGKAVSISMTNISITNRTDDAVEKVSEEAVEEAVEKVSEEVSKEDSDSDSDWESISSFSEVSARSSEYHYEPMGFSLRGGVQLDDEDMFEIEDIFRDEGSIQQAPRVSYPLCHKRIEELRKDLY